MKLVIMRGPSGSGKSTYAQNNYPGARIVSSDNYFMHNGIYRFDPTKLAEAHTGTIDKVIQLLRDKEPLIVVDNTNVHQWEYRKFILLSGLTGCKVEVVEFRPITVDDIRLCIKRNTHGVPAEVVARMCYEFEDDPQATVRKITR